jgi:hypothetical protein
MTEMKEGEGQKPTTAEGAEATTDVSHIFKKLQISMMGFESDFLSVHAG